MLAVRGGEGVVDIDIAERGEFLGEGLVVFLLARMEAGVFEAQNVAVAHFGDGCLRLGTDAVRGERNRALDDPRHLGDDRPQRIFRIGPVFGAAEMRQQDHLAALVGDLGDGRGDFFDAGRVRDLAVLHGHVEIDAQQDALALHVGVVEATKSHGGRLGSACDGRRTWVAHAGGRRWRAAACLCQCTVWCNAPVR